MTCGDLDRTPIPGGYTEHACGLTDGHYGAHECRSMENSPAPCTHTWHGFPWVATDPRWDSPQDRSRKARDRLTLTRG